MSFKTWALANPTLTYEYKQLQAELAGIQSKIAAEEQILEDAKNGILPEQGVGLFSTARFPLLDLSYYRTDDEREEATIRKKKAAYATELEGAIQSATDNLNGYTRDYGKDSYTGEGLFEKRAKLEIQIALFDPASIEFQWRKRDISVSVYALDKALCSRLGSFPEWTMHSLVEHDDEINLSDLLRIVEEGLFGEDGYLYTWYEDGVTALRLHTTSRVWSSWVAVVVFAECSFTRVATSADRAVAYALLDFLDHCWDDIWQAAVDRSIYANSDR